MTGSFCHCPTSLSARRSPWPSGVLRASSSVPLSTRGFERCILLSRWFVRPLQYNTVLPHKDEFQLNLGWPPLTFFFYLFLTRIFGDKWKRFRTGQTSLMCQPTVWMYWPQTMEYQPVALSFFTYYWTLEKTGIAAFICQFSDAVPWAQYSTMILNDCCIGWGQLWLSLKAKTKGLDQTITHLTQGIPKLRLFGSA